MKRPLFIITGILIAAAGTGFLFWTTTEKAIEKPPQLANVYEIEEINNAIAPGAGTVAAPAPASAVAPPVAQQKMPAVQQPTAVAVPEAGIVSSAKPLPKPAAKEKEPELTLAEMNEIHAQVKQSIENDFKDKVSFPLDESKMIAFAQASTRVSKINNKWDVQIAGAETDTMAIEYSNFAVEEITKSLQSINGLTLDQYNEMSKLTAVSQDFNKVYQVYKKLIEEDVIQVPPTPVTPAATTPVAVKPAAQPPAKPVNGIQLKPDAVIKPATAPVSPGTAPAPQDSPKPPYSQPTSR